MGQYLSKNGSFFFIFPEVWSLTHFAYTATNISKTVKASGPSLPFHNMRKKKKDFFFSQKVFFVLSLSHSKFWQVGNMRLNSLLHNCCSLKLHLTVMGCRFKKKKKDLSHQIPMLLSSPRCFKLMIGLFFFSFGVGEFRLVVD